MRGSEVQLLSVAQLIKKGIIMKAEISKTNIKSFKKKYNENSILSLSRNALTRSNIMDVAMDWDTFRKIDHTYSHVIKNEMKKVTNQKSSGRCWGFAGLNLMRITLSEKYKLVYPLLLLSFQ